MEFWILDHCVLGEVLFSLIPLLIFIIFVLYAFCRMGVFAVCNPMRMCPNSPDTQVDLPSITPKKLLNYKRGLVAKKNQALAAFQQASGSPGDRPPDPDSGGTGGIAIPGKLKYIIFSWYFSMKFDKIKAALKLLFTLYSISDKK